MTSTAPLPRILIVDDEAALRRAVARELRREFEVTAAGTCAEALQLLPGQPPIVAIISDYLLGPGPTGLDLLAEVARCAPDCRRVLFSGSISTEMGKDAVARGLAHAFVEKPWEPGSLAKALRRPDPPTG